MAASDIIIRPEAEADHAAIHALTLAAFAPMPFSAGTEAPIIDALRSAGDLTLSLVAVAGGEVVGHIAFSPVSIDGTHAGWYGLGPISVAPSRQRSGIGRALVEAGLAAMRRHGASGIALIGDPALYARLGFASDGDLTYHQIDTAFVQHITFIGAAPRGELRFAEAFESAGQT